jgi:hypothetical protein
MGMQKELEYCNHLLMLSHMENIILINYMDAQRWNGQMVAVGGENSMMVKRKDMEHG